MTKMDEASLWEAAHVPDWVALTELPDFLQRAFGHPPDATIPAILPAVKNGSLLHRVTGLEPMSSPRRASLPPGYGYDVQAPYRRTYVQVWDLVHFQPRQGTVGQGDSAVRYAVEVLWASVVRWEMGSRTQLRRAMVRGQEVIVAVRAADSSKLKKAPARRGYKESDTPLVHDMHRMVDAREVQNPHQAARKVAFSAAGANTDFESKVKRLLKLYSETFGTAQT